MRRRVVTRVGWRDGEPVLRVRGLDGEVVDQPVLGPIDLVVRERRCIGRHVDGKDQACPGFAVLTTGRQCGACLSADGFRPCMICTGFDCPRLSATMRRRCQARHHLYLAAFGQGVKVGTASQGRQLARLVEQGPLAAVHIAAGAGPRIKQMEHLISTSTAMVEAVRRSQKLYLLEVGGSVEQARADVLDAARLAEDLLRREYAEELHEPRWVAMPPLAERSRDRARGRTPWEIREGHRLVGEVVGMVGPVALLDDAGAHVLVDLGGLVGRAIEQGDGTTAKRSSVQLGLFAR